MKEYERFDRIGTTPHRSYYIPFAQEDVVRTKHSILDRTSSSRFTSLDGVWQIKQLDHVEDFNVNEKVTKVFQFLHVFRCMDLTRFSI